ncbi:MAG: HAD family hydrolase [Candidatus Hodarchaeales archaeon]
MKFYYQYKLRSELENRLKKTKGVLFDLDGVLVDSTESWIIAIEEILKKEDVAIPTRTTLIRMIAKTTYEQLQELCQDKSSEEIRPLTDMVDSYFIKNIEENVKIFEGSHLILSILKKLGFKLAIVTNNNRELTKKILDLFNLQHYFDEVITLNDVVAPKPDPDPIIRGINKLRLEKEDVIFVGDSPSDLEASQAANVLFVLLERQGVIFDSLEVTGEFFVVKDLFELKKLFI